MWMSRSGGLCWSISLRKGEPLLMTMARRKMGDQLAVEIIERGEQGQRAVPHVIMSLGADVANAQRQTRLRALERLALRFLIAAQHQCLLGRIEIEPDHVPELLFKTLVV